MKRIFARMRDGARRVGVLALALAFVAMANVQALADHDGTTDVHTPPPEPALTMPSLGFDAGQMVDAASGEAGPLLGKVLLVALSLIVLAFAFRKVRRFVTGGA